MAKKKNQAARIEAEMIAVVETVVGKIELRGLQVLTSATPVKTGFARAGWTPSVGSAVSERLDAPANEALAKSRARTMRATNLAKAKAIAATFKVSMGSAFLANNVPYVEFLNRGSSAQAGAKFIERGIEQTVRSFDQRGIKTKIL